MTDTRLYLLKASLLLYWSITELQSDIFGVQDISHFLSLLSIISASFIEPVYKMWIITLSNTLPCKCQQYIKLNLWPLALAVASGATRQPLVNVCGALEGTFPSWLEFSFLFVMSLSLLAEWGGMALNLWRLKNSMK